MVQCVGEADLVQTVDRFWDDFLRYARSKVAIDEAEDTVQDAIVKVFSRIRDGAAIENMEAYVWTAVRNQCSDWGRKRQVDWSRNRVPYSLILQMDSTKDKADHGEWLYTETSVEGDPEYIFITQEDYEYLHWAILELDIIQHTAVYLRFFEEMTGQEMADELGTSYGAAKQRLLRGVRNLGDILGGQGDTA